jgi:hypothetical protein
VADGRVAKYKFSPDLSGGQFVAHTWHDPVAAIVRIVPYVFTLLLSSFKFRIACSLYQMRT